MIPLLSSIAAILIVGCLLAYMSSSNPTLRTPLAPELLENDLFRSPAHREDTTNRVSEEQGRDEPSNLPQDSTLKLLHEI